MDKRVSIIIAVYNGAATVSEAIESALAQEVAGTEIIVVDDGSTDSTPQVLESYRPSIKVIHRANGGLCAARNTGVTAASGEYIALLDADDLWLPSRLSYTVSALDKNPRSVVAFGDFIPMDDSGALLDRSLAGSAPSHRDLLQQGSPIIPSAVTIRRSALQQAGGFCEEFKGCAGGEDHYMWLLLSEQGEFEYVAEPLAIHRRDSPAAIAEKYQPGLETFVRMVRGRYGKLGEKRVHEARRYLAGMLLAAAANELKSGNTRGAAYFVCRALTYRPFVLLQPSMVSRMLRLDNARLIGRSVAKFATARK